PTRGTDLNLVAGADAGRRPDMHGRHALLSCKQCDVSTLYRYGAHNLAVSHRNTRHGRVLNHFGLANLKHQLRGFNSGCRPYRTRRRHHHRDDKKEVLHYCSEKGSDDSGRPASESGNAGKICDGDDCASTRSPYKMGTSTRLTV